MIECVYHEIFCVFSEILGALVSVFTIWLVTGVLVYLAVERLISNDYEIEGTVMLITSGCAVAANIMYVHSSSTNFSFKLNEGAVNTFVSYILCRMALTLYQSGHGHSHGGLSSHGNGHSHGKKKNHSHTSANYHNLEDQAGKKKTQENASVRAAFVHVIGDLLQSVSVLVSALIIFFRVRGYTKRIHKHSKP